MGTPSFFGVMYLPRYAATVQSPRLGAKGRKIFLKSIDKTDDL